MIRLLVAATIACLPASAYADLSQWIQQNQMAQDRQSQIEWQNRQNPQILPQPQEPQPQRNKISHCWGLLCD